MNQTNDDIQFLIDLQQELNNQENDCQAAPRFWSAGDYRWVECMEDNAERYYVYLPNAGESYELDSCLKDIKEEEDLSGEALEEFEEIGCEVSAIEWIQKYYDEDAYLIPTKKEHFVRENTMFLTKAEAKRHIELNHYHYTKEAHTYAMTAWRAPKTERVLKILSEFDFAEIKQLREENERLKQARPLKEWHEDHGDVLWWTFPIEEPPYCGTPLDDDWPEHHTHWTPIICPDPPKEETHE